MSGRGQRREKVDGAWPAAGLSVTEGRIAAEKEQNIVREAGARELEGDTARIAWL